MRIDITNVHRRYDDVAALDGVDFTVESGEAYGPWEPTAPSPVHPVRTDRRPRPTRRGSDYGRRSRREGVGVAHPRGDRRPPGGPRLPAGRDGTRDAGVPRGRSRDRCEPRGTRPSGSRAPRRRSASATRSIAPSTATRRGCVAGSASRPRCSRTRPSVLLDEPTAGLDPNGVAALREVLTRVREETGVRS